MMRPNTIPLLTLVALLAVPGQLLAQDMRVLEDSEQLPAALGTREVIQHQVRSGDTLWDLSDSYYGSPWYWPQVWSNNAQISNPHYIYPGDVVRFVPLSEALLGPPVPTEVQSRLDPHGPAVAGARIRFLPREWDHQVYVRYVGFVTDEEIRAAGQMRFSREEHELLTELDEVYIDFERLPRVRPGDRWTILSLQNDLIHPIYHRKLGTKVDILGVVDIRAVTRKMAIGVIARSYKEITRGSLVVPLVPNFSSVKPRPNTKNVRGYVVDCYTDSLGISQHQIVYVDKGVREGVEVGNRFHVVRRGDGIRKLGAEELELLPWEPFGEVMVVESRDHHSTGLVITSLSELEIGDVVEMRKDF